MRNKIISLATIVMLLVTALGITDMTFATLADPLTWVSRTVPTQGGNTDTLIDRYKTTEYEYWTVINEGSNFYTIWGSHIKPEIQMITNVPHLLLDSGATGSYSTAERTYYKNRVYNPLTNNVISESTEILTDGGVGADKIMSTDPLSTVFVYYANYSIVWNGVELNDGPNNEENITVATSTAGTPIISYTNNTASPVRVILTPVSTGTSNVTILEPSRYMGTNTISSGIPFIIEPSEVFKVRWNSGIHVKLVVNTTLYDEGSSNVLAQNDIWSWTNNTGAEQTVSVFANNGLNSQIFTGQNYYTIIAGYPREFQVAVGQSINIKTISTNSVTITTTQNVAGTTPDVLNDLDFITITSPSNNSVTAYNSQDVTFRIKYPKAMFSNLKVGFHVNNGKEFFPLGLTETGFKISDNSTNMWFDKTYKVGVRLEGGIANKITIRLIGGQVITEKSVTVTQKAYEDNGNGIDVLTQQPYIDEELPPLEPGANDDLEFIDRNDYSDDIFGELKYFGDKLISYITMPFKYIGETLKTVLEWLEESATWIGDMNKFMSGIFGFLPDEIIGAMTMLVLVAVILAIIRMLRG